MSTDFSNVFTKIKSIIKRTDPNDKICKRLFNMNDDQFNADALFISEKIFKTKQSNAVAPKEILTPISLEYSEYTQKIMATKPRFNAFDREVCFACISEQTAGNQFTTANTIYRNMTGSNVHPSDKMVELIKSSLSKLFFSEVTIDLTEISKKYGYCKREGDKYIIHGSIIPGTYVDGVINGQKHIIIKFYEPSPLFLAAEVKNKQILTYNKELLDVPIRNSPEVISIKSYILRRVLEIIAHKMTPTITFDDVFEKNQLKDTDKYQKVRLRNNIYKMFEFWKKLHLISEYKVNKEGHIPVSISFSYKKIKM